MNEEDIKILEEFINKLKEHKEAEKIRIAVEHLLQAYKEQEKVIDETAEEFKNKTLIHSDKSKEEIKQYFINKVKENK